MQRKSPHDFFSRLFCQSAIEIAKESQSKSSVESTVAAKAIVEGTVVERAVVEVIEAVGVEASSIEASPSVEELLEKLKRKSFQRT